MAEEHNHRKEIMTLDKDGAGRFVGEGAFDVVRKPSEKAVFGWSACIDGRDGRRWGDKENPLPPERFPGAGLGLLLSAYAGIARFEEGRDGETRIHDSRQLHRSPPERTGQ